MKDGRIILSWNNVLGYPMYDVRYSAARQCLHAAVSDDGLKTLRGARIIMRKRNGDPDNVLNCYPFCTPASDTEVFVRPFSVQDREGTMWVQPQAHLLKLRPDDLLDGEMHNSFGDWITECEWDGYGIRMASDAHGIAYACVNFPYAQEGRITLHVEGTLPENTRILLSDCYLDRATFLPKNRSTAYDEFVSDLYTALVPDCGGEWVIEWNPQTVTLRTEHGVQTVPANGRGFNHLGVLFEGTDACLKITGFDMHRVDGNMETGIEY